MENEAEIMANLASLREIAKHTQEAVARIEKRAEDEAAQNRSLALDIRGLILGQEQSRKDISGATRLAKDAHTRIDGLNSSMDNARGAAKVIHIVFGVIISFMLVGLAALFNWFTAHR